MDSKKLRIAAWLTTDDSIAQSAVNNEPKEDDTPVDSEGVWDVDRKNGGSESGG